MAVFLLDSSCGQSLLLRCRCVALGAKLYFAAFLPSIFPVGILAGKARCGVCHLPHHSAGGGHAAFRIQPTDVGLCDLHQLRFVLFSVLLTGSKPTLPLTMLIVGSKSLNRADDGVATQRAVFSPIEFAEQELAAATRLARRFYAASDRF